MPRPTSSKYFRVFKLASPNGRKEWKAEGRPTGKRERYYFATEKEARAAALDLNNQIAAFGTRNNLTDTERVMASECLAMLAPYGKTLYEAVHFYREVSRPACLVGQRTGRLRTGRSRIRTPPRRRRNLHGARPKHARDSAEIRRSVRRDPG